jgi:hypothetical protein
LEKGWFRQEPRPSINRWILRKELIIVIKTQIYRVSVPMMNQSVTDFDIQALADDELEWEEAKRVRAHLDTNPDAQRRYNELCRQKNLLKVWWKRTTPIH